MRRSLVFLAVALALSSATAQAPLSGRGDGSPIAVQPIQIGPRSEGGGAVDQQRAREQGQGWQPAGPQAVSPPAPLSNCNAGGCWDSQGRRYNATGDGLRFINPEGRLCEANGKFIHCN
jgi:hypothetical protein